MGLIRRQTARVRAITLALIIGLIAAACGDDSAESDSAPSSGSSALSVVVTYPVLGAVVRDAVGDKVAVTTLIPDGADPHDWSPSGKDVAAMQRATVLVVNGLGLEEGAEKAIDRAKQKGVTIFTAADAVATRRIEIGDEKGEPDPHIWMDPLAVRQVVSGLGKALAAKGIEVSAGVARVEADLTVLDQKVRDILAPVPAANRRLVTGHESMGYFADRYGFRLIGAIVSSLTTNAEVSPADLAKLRDQIVAEKVGVIFTEAGASPKLAAQVSRSTGAKLVEIATERLPDDKTYRSFILAVAEALAGGLAR